MFSIYFFCIKNWMRKYNTNLVLRKFATAVAIIIYSHSTQIKSYACFYFVKKNKKEFAFYSLKCFAKRRISTTFAPRDGEVVSRWAHNPKVIGSNPILATQ
jgi:hypothetical protein